MIRDLIPILGAWQANGQRCALATVVRVHGRAPLPAGASLIVGEDGATAGAVSGGCVEQEVVRAAQAVLRGGPPRRLRFAPGLDGLVATGLPCGGGIDVWVQEWTGEGPQQGFAEAVLAGAAAVLTTVMESADETFELAVDVPPRMVLVGAGLVAGALCGMARGLGWTPVVIEPREAIAAHAPLHAAAELLLAWPDQAIGALASQRPFGDDDVVLVLSHQPALDDAALHAALATGAGFIGALGSRAAHSGRLARLRAEGVGAKDLARIIGPVGLDLGGWSHGEVALSIASELVAARHGRGGGRLAAGSGPIQATAPVPGGAPARPPGVSAAPRPAGQRR